MCGASRRSRPPIRYLDGTAGVLRGALEELDELLAGDEDEDQEGEEDGDEEEEGFDTALTDEDGSGQEDAVGSSESDDDDGDEMTPGFSFD